MGARSGVLVVLMLALAGCSSDDEADAPEAGGAGLSLDAPTWSVGDTWLYANTDGQGATSSMALVVTGEEGGDYIVDTNEPTVAYYHAVEEASYLGKIRKSDLAGSQGSDRVQYFDFPLEQDKTWTTNWDGLNVGITVMEITPDGARMQAMAGQRLFAEYTYGRGFLEEITFYDENETEAFRMELSDSGSGFSGTVYRYTIGDPLEYKAEGATMQGVSVDLADATEVGIRAEADCGGAPAGNMGGIFTEREPDEPHLPQAVLAVEPEYAYEWDCMQGQTDLDEAVVPVDPAMAHSLDLGAAVPDGSLTITLEPRTLETIPI